MVTAGAAQSGDNFPTLIGELYARWTLDCLVDLGYGISLDAINRPQLFTGSDIPDVIVELRMSYGTSAKFPNGAQRLAMMTPIFGRSDGLKPDASSASTPFYLARKKFLDACVAFSERSVDTGVPMLEGAVRIATDSFRAYFEGLRGKSVEQSAGQIGAVSEAVIDILTSSGVARVYSVTPVAKDWPLTSIDPSVNSIGAKLVEAVGGALPIGADCKFNFAKFILLQQLAQAGEGALPLVFTANTKSDEGLQPLISHGYIWAISLRAFQQAL